MAAILFVAAAATVGHGPALVQEKAGTRPAGACSLITGERAHSRASETHEDTYMHNLSGTAHLTTTAAAAELAQSPDESMAIYTKPHCGGRRPALEATWYALSSIGSDDLSPTAPGMPWLPLLLGTLGLRHVLKERRRAARAARRARRAARARAAVQLQALARGGLQRWFLLRLTRLAAAHATCIQRHLRGHIVRDRVATLAPLRPYLGDILTTCFYARPVREAREGFFIDLVFFARDTHESIRVEDALADAHYWLTLSHAFHGLPPPAPPRGTPAAAPQLPTTKAKSARQQRARKARAHPPCQSSGAGVLDLKGTLYFIKNDAAYTRLITNINSGWMDYMPGTPHHVRMRSVRAHGL